MSNRALECPGAAHGAGQEAVGFGVVDELFFGRVPVEFSAQTDGDVVEVADRVGAHGRLDVADRLPARFDAFEEVALVVVAHGQSNVAGGERLLE